MIWHRSNQKEEFLETGSGEESNKGMFVKERRLQDICRRFFHGKIKKRRRREIIR